MSLQDTIKMLVGKIGEEMEETSKSIRDLLDDFDPNSLREFRHTIDDVLKNKKLKIVGSSEEEKELDMEVCRELCKNICLAHKYISKVMELEEKSGLDFLLSFSFSISEKHQELVDNFLAHLKDK